jgi:SAM-dependent methyltransferase
MTVSELYSAKQLPTFQNRMFRTRGEATNCAKGDMELVRDLETGLIFNKAFRPELMRYDADYQNEQAVSPYFCDHLDDVTGIMSAHFRDQALIEVGCGKGYFLEHLLARGFNVTGLDPAYEGDNPNVIKAYFNAGMGLRADGVVLRHVLEHVQDPLEFLRQIRDANGGCGKIYIEVPCFDWIADHCAWFDIFYEHVNYFRLSDFYRIFGTVHESGKIFGAQYLYVVADLASLRRPRLDASDSFCFPTDFLAALSRHAALIKTRDVEPRQNFVVWGGASKGVIFSLFMQRTGADIDFVIDINPAKQGKYLPASGLKVSAPEEVLPLLRPGATIFVMNSNYLPEIRQMTFNQFNYISVDHEYL